MGEDHSLSLEEILDETNQLDVSGKTRQWLQQEALNHNPKIEVTDDQRYMFKAPFKLRDKKSLLKLLKRRDLNGEGGVFFDDVNESLPKAEKIVQSLTGDGKIIQIPRPCDKKKVLFYYDHTTDLDLDDEFVKLWRTTAKGDSLPPKLTDEELKSYCSNYSRAVMLSISPRLFSLKKSFVVKRSSNVVILESS